MLGWSVGTTVYGNTLTLVGSSGRLDKVTMGRRRIVVATELPFDFHRVEELLSPLGLVCVSASCYGSRSIGR